MASPRSRLVPSAAVLVLAPLAAAQDKMVFTGNGNGFDPIRSADLDGSNVQTLVTGLGAPQGVALDHAGGKMYWTDPPRIQRSDLTGANVETIVSIAGGSPRGIAVDGSAGKVYWTDIIGDRIQRSDLDGGNVEALVTGLDAPTAIALDNAGRMFWTDVNNDVIQSANLDGSNVQTVLNQDGWGIAIDCGAGKMYWTVTSGIRRADLDGGNVETLVSGLSWSRAIAIDARGGKMYWSDIVAQKIQRADLDGSNVQDLITSGIDTILGIDVDLQGCNASWNRYGSGWPGTNGTPALTPSGDPVLGCDVTIGLDNSAGTATAGVLVAGSTSTMVPTPLGGTLLVTPSLTANLSVPASGLQLAVSLPPTPVLCGVPVFLQAAQVDSGASMGVSFTPGLRLVLGY